MPYSWTWVVSHWLCRPWPHMKQVPHETLNGTTTRSPAFELGDARPDLGDHAHRLVAEDVALAEERPEHLVQVQVGAADPGGGDLAR